MTNRELFDYLKFCEEDSHVNTSKKEYEIFLDSEVSVREAYNAFKECGIEYYDSCTEFVRLFKRITSDKDREEALRILSKALHSYARYFEMGDPVIIEDKIYKVLESDGLSLHNLEYRLKILDIDNGNSVDFNDFGSYIIKHYENYDGSKYFSLKACSLGCNDMLNIGAITFKNGEYEVYKLESKKDIKRIDNMIKDLDYDVCICENASKIIGRIDKMVG